MLEEAMGDDPSQRYVHGGLPNAWERRVRHFKWTWVLFYPNVQARVMYTIGPGDAIVVGIPPAGLPPRKGIHRVLTPVLEIVAKAGMAMCSNETRKRDKELEEKSVAAMKAASDEIGSDFMQLLALGTRPSKQRRGYGLALVNYVTDKADALGCPTFLISTNTVNNAFYESLGFFTVAQITLGDSNPKWKEPPVVVHAMVRKAPSYGDEKRARAH